LNDSVEIKTKPQKQLKSQIEELKKEFNNPTFRFMYIYYGDNYKKFTNSLNEEEGTTETYFILSSIDKQNNIKLEIK
jgi:hypothetical protein